MQDIERDMAKDINVNNVYNFYIRGMLMITLNCLSHEVPLLIRFFFCIRGGLLLTCSYFQNL